jgi:pimeloyl-ACP methyl ester carboxylesterase
MAMRITDPLHQKSEWETERTETITGNGDRQLTYTEYGCSDGVPVMFLHGTPGSRRLGKLFDTTAEEFGIRVLAPDRPGYGRSTPWTSRSIGDADQFISTILDNAGVQTVGLIAFSGGSPHALATAATQSDRVTRVDIISGVTPPHVSEETPTTQRLLMRMATTTPFVLRSLLRGQAWLAARLDPSFILAQYTTGDNAESVSDAAAEIVKEDFVEAFAQSRRGAVTEFRHTANRWDISFDDISTEVCFWHGENDTNVPISGVRRFESTLPNARIEALSDTDHLHTLLRTIPNTLAKHQ